MKLRWLVLGCACFLVSCKGGKKSKTSVPPSVESSLAEMPDAFFKPTVFEEGSGICTDELDSTPDQTSPLSAAFLNNCSGCHGTAGQGGEFPSLRNISSEETFKRIVRNGGARMPAFSADLISDADLAKDFQILASKDDIVAIDSRSVPTLPLLDMDDASYDAVMREGLEAWRIPGERGGCVSCHGPDGIDLARIGYPNSAMLRRALGQGLPWDQSMRIVRMMAAQRWRYKISKPCHSKSFIPLQPGGKILTGTAAERDDGLVSALVHKGIDFKTAITSESAATSFTEKLASLDVKSIPIGVTLNHWTEDVFHGEEHSSSAEWMPEIPMEPQDANKTLEWVRLQNAYMQNPSDENLWKLMDGVELLDGRRFAESGVSVRIAREKYSSVLLLQHMMRFNKVKFPDLTKTSTFHRFNIWETAQISNVMARGCADLGDENDPFPCWKYPASFYEKMGADRSRLLNDVLKINYPWLVAGWILEPSLQLTEKGGAQIEHLHQAAEKHFERFEGLENEYNALPIHDIYFGLVRLVKSVDAPDERLPFGSGLKSKPVKGCWHKAGNGLTQWVEMTLPQVKRLVADDRAPAISTTHKDAVRESVRTINQSILYRIKNSAQAADSKCNVLSEETAAKSAVVKIAAWHTKMQWQDATITTLAQELSALLP